VRVASSADSRGESLAFALVPTSALRLEDTWHTTGLRGTASLDVSADGVCIPEEHIVSYADVLGEAPGDPLPPRTVFACVIAASAIGLARAACGAYGALLRKMARERGDVRPTALVRLAEAAADVDAADALLERFIADLGQRHATGAAMDAADRARLRMRAVRAVRLCKGAAERVLEGCGTRGHHQDAPPQRAVGDLAMLASHTALDADAAAEAAGMVEAGFEISSESAV
jgi:alkylation response protein AidB-like acyl-CoA dehydrogenase